MNPMVWHSGTGKSMEVIKISVVSGDQGGGRDESAEHRKFLAWKKYSVW